LVSDYDLLEFEKSMNDLERKILNAIQNGMPMTQEPYGDLAESIGITPDQLLQVLSEWKNDRRIRRLGAIVNHFQMGHGAGAMVVWNVPEGQIEEIGQQFAAFKKVSHAYQRPTKKNWPFSLYTMVHASSADELEQTLREMSRKSGVKGYRALKTIKELKKVPPTYISEK
jgi:DNA-binding Lrp family transcriptional regulator